ncbi:MAG: hypothetical protein ABIO35_10795 [Nitrobacter sp.]|jgi:hypothetical protein
MSKPSSDNDLDNAVQNEGSKPDVLKKQPGEKSQDERTMEKFKENEKGKNKPETITESSNDKLY